MIMRNLEVEPPQQSGVAAAEAVIQRKDTNQLQVGWNHGDAYIYIYIIKVYYLYIYIAYTLSRNPSIIIYIYICWQNCDIPTL